MSFIKNYPINQSVQRKWTLGMGLLLLSCVVNAGQKVDQTMDTTETPFVKIEHMNGKAVLKGWDKSEVRVTGELGDQTEDFEFTGNKQEVTIEVEVKRHRNGWKWNDNAHGDDLTIYVPYGSKVSYTSINASVKVYEISGKTNVEVVNGNIDLYTLTGKVDVESVNGDIDLQDINALLRVATVNGDISGNHIGRQEAQFESVNGEIDVTSNSPDFTVDTVNGDMNLKLAEVKQARLNTVNGRIDASMNLLDSGDVNASSVGGRIKLTFQKNVSAQFDIEAHAGGSIDNNISSDRMIKAKYGPRRWLEFTHNGGSANVDISTVSGRVVLNN
ncbi:DUF4097 family beta strand repeat-containing protein [Alteromonas ponticola]|uniref:DUF4097 family beta strand repeat-containing protein n=1 Tax=Alteromonas aquimaris TaxID=2998417 RepID=A0ABT3P9F4_9ALTE|nr:DUF4097 family beta strand repeat-containing protein [Alteromonas aquimaris]MCW8109155.1 DUF4097 family beta strand repeat-containing protein [Alteromonas aquimaris]